MIWLKIYALIVFEGSIRNPPKAETWWKCGGVILNLDLNLIRLSELSLVRLRPSDCRIIGSKPQNQKSNLERVSGLSRILDFYTHVWSTDIDSWELSSVFLNRLYFASISKKNSILMPHNLKYSVLPTRFYSCEGVNASKPTCRPSWDTKTPFWNPNSWMSYRDWSHLLNSRSPGIHYWL